LTQNDVGVCGKLKLLKPEFHAANLFLSDVGKIFRGQSLVKLNFPFRFSLSVTPVPYCFFP